MKISKFIDQKLSISGDFEEFTTPTDVAAIQVRDDDEHFHVYIGDGNHKNNFQYMGAVDLRKAAKLFTKLAERLEARA